MSLDDVLDTSHDTHNLTASSVHVVVQAPNAVCICHSHAVVARDASHTLLQHLVHAWPGSSIAAAVEWPPGPTAPQHSSWRRCLAALSPPTPWAAAVWPPQDKEGSTKYQLNFQAAFDTTGRQPHRTSHHCSAAAAPRHTCCPGAALARCATTLTGSASIKQPHLLNTAAVTAPPTEHGRRWMDETSGINNITNQAAP
jgi:hypothetical protein